MTMRQNNERHARIFLRQREKHQPHALHLVDKNIISYRFFCASHLLVRKFITLLVTSKGFKCDV